MFNPVLESVGMVPSRHKERPRSWSKRANWAQGYTQTPLSPLNQVYISVKACLDGGIPNEKLLLGMSMDLLIPLGVVHGGDNLLYCFCAQGRLS